MRQLKVYSFPWTHLDDGKTVNWDDARTHWANQLRLDLRAKKMAAKDVPSADIVRNRILAEVALCSMCPDYFVLFEPLTRAHATEGEIMQAKRELIKARYPKFYKEVFEDAAETETKRL